MDNKAFRIALLAVPLAATLFFTPRLTLEQYEIPKQAGLFVLLAVVIAAAPGVFSPRRWATHPALVLFLLAAALSTLLSISIPVSLAGDNENMEGLATWTAYSLLFLAGNSLNRASGLRLATAVTVSASASALYGILQLAGIDPFRGEYFRHILGFAGNPDFLAEQMAMALPLAMGLAIAGRPVPGALLTALFSFILFLTASRAGTLAGMAGIALLLFLLRETWRPWKKTLVWTGIPALLVLFILSESMLPPDLTLRSRLVSSATGEGFAHARGLMWSGVARVIRDNPLTGSGTDTLKTSFLRHSPPGYASIAGLGTSARKAHNEPLHFWSTMGVLGLGAYLWLLLSAFRNIRPQTGRPMGAAITAAVCAYLVQNIFSFGTSVTSPVFWLFLGFLSRRTASGTEEMVPRYRLSPLAVMTILVAGWSVARFTADGYAYRGNEEARAGHQQASTPWFARAALLAPYEQTYLVRWAGGLEAEGKLAEALPLFEKSWSRNPKNGILLGNVGRVGFALASAGNPEAREQALVRQVMAVELAPNQPTLYGAVIMSLQQMGRIPERDAWVRKLQSADPVWAARLLGGAPPN